MPVLGKKFDAQLKAEFEAIIKGGHRAMKPREIDGVGKKVIALMVERINAGISPIRGAGRFAAYKAAASKAEVRKEARKIEDKKRRKAFTASTQSAIQRSYPYSVQGKYPNKQVRPVNLRLSGKFLQDLRSFGEVQINRLILSIGFTDPLSEAKERGHREGANGQASRPIIPVGDERFTPEIETLLFNEFTKLIRRVFERLR